MSALSDHLDQLLQQLERRPQPPPPYDDVRVFEAKQVNFKDGKYHVHRVALLKVSEYEGRFDELQREGHSWIDPEVLGVYERHLVIAVRYSEGAQAGFQTLIHSSGPDRATMDRQGLVTPIKGWSTDHILTVIE
jgi:hypothetical protein